MLSEIRAIDPDALQHTGRSAVIFATDVATVDRDFLAAQAIMEADRRSTGSGGRFSLFDVRGGAIRAVVTSGVVADRAVLRALIEDVTGRALATGTVALIEGAGTPAHVKAMMATVTAALAAQLEDLQKEGDTVPADAIHAVAADTL